MSDKKPVIPLDFPSDLRELVIQGWSKDPKKRLPIQEFKSALNKILAIEGKHQPLMFQDNNYLKEKREQLDSKVENNIAEKTEKEFCSSTKKGESPSSFSLFNFLKMIL